MSLIDKIVGGIKHWSAKLLSYAGRIQLVKSISFVITNYWLTVIPLPKMVIKKINSICRALKWTGSDAGSRKSPVAWRNMCKPVSQGGLVLVDLEVWDKCASIKLLWNLCNKRDNLWIK